jgi:hypothetical protein
MHGRGESWERVVTGLYNACLRCCGPDEHGGFAVAAAMKPPSHSAEERLDHHAIDKGQ